jgi:hypothetical protein
MSITDRSPLWKPRHRAPVLPPQRCDRCGAEAVALTHHRAADLAWCGHHLRRHAAGLEAAGVPIFYLRR